MGNPRFSVQARDVLREVSKAPESRLTFHELCDRLAVPARHRPKLKRLLRGLLRDGSLRSAKGQSYRLGANAKRPTSRAPRPGRGRGRSAAPSSSRQRGRSKRDEDWAVEGIVRRNRRGFGFLIREDDEEDLFLPAREMEDVFDGDRVRVIPVPGKFGRSAGELQEIVERGRTEVTGVYRKLAATHYVEPDPDVFDEPIELVPGAVEPEDGEVVAVEIREYPRGRDPAVGSVVEILGAVGELGTIIQHTLHKYGVLRRFPSDALEQAESLPESPTSDSVENRVDLRDVPTFTIDGANARDFDDAISLETTNDGYRLRVSIADVAHYVGLGSPLDAEAYERGTSAYYPDRVIPMLPEKLSNGIASLRPDEERLTLTADLRFDERGRRTHMELYESVIRSHGRWTYDEVAQVLDGDEGARLPQHGDLIRQMAELMKELRALRDERGSLDLDLPESVVVLGEDGRVREVRRSERHDSHRVIEEFMLAANEAVADWFAERSGRTIFRVHAPPDPTKLRGFLEFARAYGHTPDFGTSVSSATLSKFLEDVAGAPAERALHSLLLRTMMRAEYSAENLGHYGLASERYLHFTSPIRRYPDLMVHRLAKAILHREKRPYDGGALEDIAKHCSQREARVAKSEFDVLDILRADFVADRVGETFDGVITNVIEEGFFVELLDVAVEGKVRVQDLADDWYKFLPDPRILLGRRSRRRFAIGDPVHVEIQAVHRAQGKIELKFLKGGSRAPADGVDRESDRRRPSKPNRGPRRSRKSSKRR